MVAKAIAELRADREAGVITVALIAERAAALGGLGEGELYALRRVADRQLRAAHRRIL